MIAPMNIAKTLLRILCVMLLVVAGLAHRPAEARSFAPAGLAVYVLPDGSVSELCLPGEDGNSGKLGWQGCEACRIASGTILPLPPVDGAAIERIETAFIFPAARGAESRLPSRSGASPRGPPAFFA